MWTIGEVASSPQFTHIAYDDFRVIRENLCGRNRVTTGRQVPYALFIDPGAAHIGLSENETQRRGLKRRLFKVPVNAGELMSVVQIAMLGNMPYTMIRDAVLTHLTLAEGLVVLFSSTPGKVGEAHQGLHRR